MKTSNRRKFLRSTLKAGIIAAAGLPIISDSLGAIAASKPKLPNRGLADGNFKFAQVPLPYSYAALEPNVDALTLEIHYTKHHAAYIKNVNEAIAAENLNFSSEKDFFDHASQLSPKARNNGGGAWNHNFFWESLQAGGSSLTVGKLQDAIQTSFGSVDKFKEEFGKAALGRFGSGWVWLVNDSGTLKIGSTANQDNPLFDNAQLKGTPILALDVWEHAYYIKYQNRRADYINNWWNIVNWEEAAKRLG
jgi:superoxide dismutase, Fe-Mn family